MLNKGIAVTGSAGTMSWASALESAGREAKFGPQAAAVHRQARAAHHIKTARLRPGNLRLALARGLLAALAAPLLPLHGALAQQAPSAEVARDFDLPAGELAAALEAFRAQSGIELVYAPGLVAARQAKAVSGRMGWRDALHRLLQGSGLGYRQVDGRVFLATEPEGNAGAADRAVSARPKPAAPQAAPPAPTATEMATVTVTGTRIRGGTTPSPVTTIDSERIREEGFADLGEVIRSVPQNFSGGQNPGVLMGNVAGGGLANQNVTGGASLNLRGLGPDATLTLLNGRRMSYGGFVQAVDISAIPVEAVQRIEIVADGASAMYGSDAVAGVGNVILKRDYEGVAVGARYGGATNGGLTTREYSVTGGAAWSSGGLIATFKDASVDPIFARQRAYTEHLLEPSTIYPGSDLRSGLVSAYQWLGDTVELRLDALRTERDQAYDYYFGGTATYNVLRPETTTSLVSPGIEFALPNDWTLSIDGAWGRDEYINDHAAVAAMDGAATPYLYECWCNESRTYELGAEGPVFPLGGGEARLAVGVGYRTNAYTQTNYITRSTVIQADESVRSAYAELNLPLAGRDSGAGGVRQLAVTAAVRSEDYGSFGSVTTPKLGFVYRPGDDVTLKASWGRSFKAPTLYQRYNAMVGAAIHPSAFGGVGYGVDDVLLFLNGGNPDLDPERARTWTASLAFHPVAFPGLDAELTWFGIDYTDRVVQPITNSVGALTNPIYAEYVHQSPTADELADVLARLGAFYNYTNAPYDPDRVVAILDARYVNATRQRIRGLDLTGSYRFDVGAGQMTVRGSASWLDSSQRTAGNPNAYDLAGTLHNPAKVNGRMGAVWTQDGFSVSAFANYTGGVIDTGNRRKGASFITLDATLRYATGERAGAWSGLELALSAQNLLDRAPPLYSPVAPLYVPPYDSTNYSAIGRVLSVSVSKHW